MDPPWSHLNLSYRGEKGKTAGYYVPKAGRGIHDKESLLGSKRTMFARTGGVE